MSAMLTVLVMLSCFVMFTAAVATMAIQRIRGTNTAILQQRTGYGCQAGFVWACEWLESQLSYDPSTAAPTYGFTAAAGNTAGFDSLNFQRPLELDPEVLVTTRIYSNLVSGPPPTVIQTPDGTNVEPGQVYIYTVAAIGGATGSNMSPASSRHLGGFGSMGAQTFTDAIRCNGQIKLTSCSLNPYVSGGSSNPGPFTVYWEYNKVNLDYTIFIPLPTGSNPVATGGPYPTAYPCRVVTNAHTAGAITQNGNLSPVIDQSPASGNPGVMGPIVCGPGSNIATAIVQTGGAVCHASPDLNQPNQIDKEPAPLFITKYKAPIQPSTVFGQPTFTGNSVAAGTWINNAVIGAGGLALVGTAGQNNEFYFGNLTINGGSLVVAPGKTNASTRFKVYIGNKLTLNGAKVDDGAGYFNAKGGGQNCPAYSYQLEFLGAGLGGPNGYTTMSITNSNVFAFIAGSDTNVTMTGTSSPPPVFAGAIKANTLTASGYNMYYDVACQEASVINSMWGRVSWTMQGVTDYGPALYDLLLAGTPGVPGSPLSAGAAGPGPGAVSPGAIGVGPAPPPLGGPTAVGAGAAGPGFTPSAVSPASAAGAIGAAAASAYTTSFWATLILGQ